MPVYKGHITLVNVNDGEKGQQGIGIKSTTIYYAISDNGATPPELQEQDLVSENGVLKFSQVGSTFKIKNNVLYAYSGNDYIPLKISGSVISSLSNWSTEIPIVPVGFYLWIKTVTIYTDNTSTITYSVSRNGTNGKDGKDGVNGESSYVHIKYSNDGLTFSDNLVTTNIEDWKSGYPRGFVGTIDMDTWYTNEKRLTFPKLIEVSQIKKINYSNYVMVQELFRLYLRIFQTNIH